MRGFFFEKIFRILKKLSARPILKIFRIMLHERKRNMSNFVKIKNAAGRSIIININQIVSIEKGSSYYIINFADYHYSEETDFANIAIIFKAIGISL